MATMRKGYDIDQESTDWGLRRNNQLPRNMKLLSIICRSSPLLLGFGSRPHSFNSILNTCSIAEVGRLLASFVFWVNCSRHSFTRLCITRCLSALALRYQLRWPMKNLYTFGNGELSAPATLSNSVEIAVYTGGMTASGNSIGRLGSRGNEERVLLPKKV